MNRNNLSTSLKILVWHNARTVPRRRYLIKNSKRMYSRNAIGLLHSSVHLMWFGRFHLFVSRRVYPAALLGLQRLLLRLWTARLTSVEPTRTNYLDILWPEKCKIKSYTLYLSKKLELFNPLPFYLKKFTSKPSRILADIRLEILKTSRKIQRWCFFLSKVQPLMV